MKINFPYKIFSIENYFSKKLFSPQPNTTLVYLDQSNRPFDKSGLTWLDFLKTCNTNDYKS